MRAPRAILSILAILLLANCGPESRITTADPEAATRRNGTTTIGSGGKAEPSDSTETTT